ncbi:hypothetical protein ABR737_43455 [Streptomyces sp. Edi2]|uniref:hypothetical protein n=1 Tax=Streptomyces sp. Edi2 TaxID=3162528 RepID=UPI003305C625
MNAAAGKKRGYGRTVDRGSTHAAPLPQSLSTKPIRVTLDLRPPMHKKLKKWCNLTAGEHELSRVDLSAVLRVLAAELLEDDVLAEKIAQKLKEGDGAL